MSAFSFSLSLYLPLCALLFLPDLLSLRSFVFSASPTHTFASSALLSPSLPSAIYSPLFFNSYLFILFPLYFLAFPLFSLSFYLLSPPFSLTFPLLFLLARLPSLTASFSSFRNPPSSLLFHLSPPSFISPFLLSTPSPLLSPLSLLRSPLFFYQSPLSSLLSLPIPSSFLLLPSASFPLLPPLSNRCNEEPGLQGIRGGIIA